MDSSSQRKVSDLEQAAFDKLLAQFDADRERAGEKYEMMRNKLVKFFEWRGSLFPEDNADQVINRVAGKLQLGEEIHDLKNYLYGVARKFFLETLKEKEREAAALEHLSQPQPESHDRDDSELRLECLEACLWNLTAKHRELIIQYYREEKGAKIESRKELAEALGIPLNALRIRAHRIRTKIDECINDCLKRPSK